MANLLTGILTRTKDPPVLGGGRNVPLNHLGRKVPIVVAITANEHSTWLFRLLLTAANRLTTREFALSWYLSSMNCLFSQIITELAPIMNAAGYQIITTQVAGDMDVNNDWDDRLPAVESDDLDRISDREVDIAAYAGILFQLIHKQISEINYNQWLINRQRALNQKLSASIDLNEGSYVPRIIMTDLCKSLQSDHKIRQYIFMSLATIIRTQPDNLVSIAASQAIDLMRFTNMAYITIINTVLVEPSHPVLYWAMLEGEVKSYVAALRYLQTLGVNAPFAKIIVAEKDNAPLNRSNFPMLSAIAREIGKKYIPSLGNLTVSAPMESLGPILQAAEAIDTAWRSRNAVAVNQANLNAIGLPGINEEYRNIIQRAVNRPQVGGGVRVDVDDGDDL